MNYQIKKNHNKIATIKIWVFFKRYFDSSRQISFIVVIQINIEKRTGSSVDIEIVPVIYSLYQSSAKKNFVWKVLDLLHPQILSFIIKT